MKKKYFLLIILFVFFLIPKNTFAYQFQYFNGQTLCASSNIDNINSQTVSNYAGYYDCATIDHIRIRDNNYVLQKDVKYELYTTLNVDVFKATTCTNNNFGLRSDFYVGNFNANSWNNASTIVWNSVDDINVGLGGSCRYKWGLVQSFTNNVNSTGLSFDFYFTSKQDIRRVEVLRFELQNVPVTGSDLSSVVNSVNSTANSIINNNNQNTQSIINNNNANTDKINNTLNDDDTTGATSEASDFFDNFTTNDHGLTGIITAPLRLINAIGSSSCSPLTFPLPFVNRTVTLPCMSTIYQTYFPTFLQVYQVITTGLIAYWVCVKIFQKVKSFKDPNDDKVEVFDL